MNTSNEEQRDLGAEGAQVVPHTSAASGQIGAASSPPPGALPPPGTVPPPFPQVSDPRAAGGPAWGGTMRPYMARDSRHKSVGLAHLLSCMPGLGQLYVGYFRRGLAFALVFATFVTLLNMHTDPLKPFLGITMAFFILYNIIDAGRRARFYNMALDGERPIDLPEDFKMPGGRGSIVWGLLLTALGILLILNLRYGVDLEWLADWLADWWPLVLVGLGLNLIYKAVRARGRQL